MTTRNDGGNETPHQHFRAPDAMWQAYAAVCGRQGRTAAAALIEHMACTIRLHGGEDEKRLLDVAEAELATRRARKGGRPRRDAPPAA